MKSSETFSENMQKKFLTLKIESDMRKKLLCWNEIVEWMLNLLTQSLDMFSKQVLMVRIKILSC